MQERTWTTISPNQLVFDLNAEPETAKRQAMPLSIILDDGQVLHWSHEAGRYFPATRVDVFPWMFNPEAPRPVFYNPDDVLLLELRRREQQEAFKTTLYWVGQMGLSVLALVMFGFGIVLVVLIVQAGWAFAKGIVTAMLPAMLEGLAVAGFYLGIGLALGACGWAVWFYFRHKHADPITAPPAPAPGGETPAGAGNMYVHQVFVNGHAAQAQQYTNAK